MTERPENKSEFWSIAEIKDISPENIDLNSLASKAFGLEVNMGSRFDEWDLVKGVDFNGNLVGLGTYIIIPSQFGTILYEDLKVVLPEYQGMGIGSRISSATIEQVPDGKLHFLARTQNEQEFFSFKKGCAKIKSNIEIVPIDRLPDVNDKEILSEFLRNHPPKRGVVNFDTFIHEGAYNKYPDMTAGVKEKQEGILLEQFLSHNGRSKQHGDALYILARNLR